MGQVSYNINKLMNNSEISLYLDSLLAEAIISNGLIAKTAQGSEIGDIINNISSFTSNEFEGINAPTSIEDKTVKLLSFIAPAGIFFTFRKLNMPWIGALLGLAASMFKVPVEQVLASIYNTIKDALQSGNKLSSDKIDAAVENAVSSGMSSAQEQSILGNPLISSSSIVLRQAKILKVAMIEYQKKENLYAVAFDPRNLLSGAGGAKPIVTKLTFRNLLVKILSWFFKIFLASAGFMVAGDAVNALVGRTGGSSSPTPVTDDRLIRDFKTKQKLLPSGSKESVSLEPPKNLSESSWFEPYRAESFSIADMLVDFAEEVYPGSINKEELIRSSPSFKNLVDKITYYNRDSIGSGITFIPKRYHSKKDLVDLFINDLSYNYLPHSLKINETNSPTILASSPKKTEAPRINPKKYPIVISDKWKSRMKPGHFDLLSKLTTEEQKKVEEYLDSLSFFDLLKIKNMSDEEQVNMFKKQVKEQLGEDVYKRVFV